MTPPPRPLRVWPAVLGLFLHTALTPAAPPAPAVPAAEAERLLYAQQVAQAITVKGERWPWNVSAAPSARRRR